MFYTKYRPQKFSEVCRPNEAADALSKQVQTGKTVHAYLFVGPRGTGKTTIARILAKSLNCTKLKANGDPCDKCDSCVSIKEGSYIDLIEIDAASNRGIDDIRELKDKIKLAPTMGKRKVYIIDEVHMLTTEAFNALLKTLEEPPKNTTFILCTTEEHKVPATIKSRCQVYRFKRATVPQIVTKLKEIVKGEEAKISEAELRKIAEASLGGFRDAETLLQQVIEGEINVDSLLSSSSKEKYIECVDYLIDKKPSKALDIVNDVYEEGIDLYVWVGELLKYLRTLIFIKSGSSRDVSDVTEELMDETKNQAKRIDISWVTKSIGILLESHKNIRSSFIPQLPVELAIVEICGSNNKTYYDNIDDEPVRPKAKIKQEVEEDDEEEEEQEEEKPKKKEEKVEEKKKERSKKDEIEEEVVEKKKEKPVISLKQIKDGWEEFIKKSKDVNHSITALLNSSIPVDVDGSTMILEVYYPFHKERLESTRTRKLLEGVAETIYGIALGIKCVVSPEKPKNLKKGESGVLTDLNVIPPKDDKSILEAFDGGLPIGNTKK